MDRLNMRSIIVAGIIFLSFCSCSEYSKLLKGRDYEKQYQLALKCYKEKKDQRAAALFQRVNSVYSTTARADTIRFYMSNLYFRIGEYENSAQAFDLFRKNYGRSTFTKDAEFMYAMSFYMISPNSERDQLNSAKAISAFNEFVIHYPNDKYTERANILINELTHKIHQKEFMVGETYYNIGYYTSAITTFKNVLKRNPETPYREDIKYTMMKSYYDYAKKSVKSKQKNRFYDVIDSYYSLISEYPNTEYKKQVMRMYNNAQSYIDGTSDIKDFSTVLKYKKNDLYAKRDEIQKEILEYEITGVKEGKVRRLKAKLEATEKSIKEKENKEASEKAGNL
ncbi:MAG: outer membrane protein assembly factor BamD [Bacteroidetes bacterium]|nr:outer membrane protein assembly factor BamD [Bacteroidota bacterium]